MNIKQQLAAAITSAQAIVKKAQDQQRELSSHERSELKGLDARIEELKAKVEAAREGDALLKRLDSISTPGEGGQNSRLRLRSAVKSIASGMQAAGGFGTKSVVPAGETITPTPVVDNLEVFKPQRLLEHLPLVQRDSPTYAFLRQAVREDPGSAGVVAPGDVKPTKAVGVTKTDARLRVVAVLSEPQDKFVLEDMSSLATFISVELTDAIEAELEAQILDGDGTGENFTGLGATEGVVEQPFVSDPLDTVQVGLGALEAASGTAQVLALAPADWLSITTVKDADGRYLHGGPVDASARTVWGVPVVLVPGIDQGNGYLLGEGAAVLSTDGRGLRTDWGTPGDAFQRNQIVARTEGRFNLDVLRPQHVVRLALTEA